ncbi:hypothetical protein R5W23_005713 [Gemmata sp. JC673]|uniref:Uncharacterized protein n=1 Tax=Gemmata algarum TaxID=2975278 RepID=A0ABU5ETE8_9BACT|nr:hypothetical protein [Gemmata algarum]MDY3558592.1 hypothetical protein [Gemmata algarum]
MSQTSSITVGKPGGEVWVACARCNGPTCHKVLAVVDTSDESPDGDIRVWDDYMVVVCPGCRTVSFCIESTNTEDWEWDERAGDQQLSKSYTLYPSRQAGRPEMDGLFDVPHGIATIYRETLAAIEGKQAVTARQPGTIWRRRSMRWSP